MTRTCLKTMLVEAAVLFTLTLIGCWLSYCQGRQDAHAQPEPTTSTDDDISGMTRVVFKSAIAIEVKQSIIYAKDCLNAAARFAHSHAFLPTDPQKSPAILINELSQAALQLYQQRKDRRFGQLITVSLRLIETADLPLSESQCLSDIVSFLETLRPTQSYFAFRNEGISASFLFVTSNRVEEMKLSGLDERVRIQLQDHFISKGFAIISPVGYF